MKNFEGAQGEAEICQWIFIVKNTKVIKFM